MTFAVRWPVAAILAAVFAYGSRGFAGPESDTAVVATDGSGQFRSIQEAINAAPQTASAGSPWVIHVRPGVYHELVYVQREKHFVQLVGGADPSKTVLSFDMFASMPGKDGKPIGTFHTPTLWVDADDFSASNLTVENTAGRVGQALALRVDGDRVLFRNCRFLGWQDTILANRGRQYFAGCTIEGAVDFVFGGATAFFDHCAVICLGDGYITAASTPQSERYGLVFSGCHISGSQPTIRTYLGRPWRDYANVIFLDSEMSAVVRPVGWHDWNKPEREKTAHFAEFGNTGDGATTGGRVTWESKLSKSEADLINPRTVLMGTDGWIPTPSN